ncbi:MAG: hypothetical protein ACQERF_05755 [Actinomycetota bacterium]
MSTDRDVVHVWGVNAEGTRWEYSDRSRARDRYLHEVVESTDKGWHDTITLYEAERSPAELVGHEADHGMWILSSDPRVETVRASATTPTI